jgi:uncharacterized protein YdiU (UPF0061 family)
LSAQQEYKTLQDLLDFTIKNYFPEIQSEGNQKYKDFFENVQKELPILWWNGSGSVLYMG